MLPGNSIWGSKKECDSGVCHRGPELQSFTIQRKTASGLSDSPQSNGKAMLLPVDAVHFRSQTSSRYGFQAFSTSEPSGQESSFLAHEPCSHLHFHLAPCSSQAQGSSWSPIGINTSRPSPQPAPVLQGQELLQTGCRVISGVGRPRLRPTLRQTNRRAQSNDCTSPGLGRLTC